MDGFYQQVHDAVCRATRRGETPVIVGDLNTLIGSDARERYPSVVGAQNFDVKTSANSEALLDLCKSNGLKIANSLFTHDRVSSVTWKHPKTGETSIKDYFAVPSAFINNIRDVKVVCQPLLLAEHALLCATLRPTKRGSMPCATQPKPKVAKVKRDLDFGDTPKERREAKSLFSRAVATELERGTIGTWSDFDAALKSAQGWVPTKEDPSNKVPDTVPSMPRYGSKLLRNSIRRQRMIA